MTKVISETKSFTTFAAINTHNIMRKYCTLLLMTLLACNLPAVTDDPRIREAENIVWDAPDSALAILETIDTLQLDSRQQAYYSLIRIQARNKAGYDISGEEKIFRLKEYYADGNDARRAAKGAFYAGRVYQMRRDHTNAAQAYLDALRYEENHDDRQLKGLIHSNLGILYYEQSHYNEAIDELTESLPYFTPGTYYTSYALKKTGNAFAILQQADSARMFYERALVSARQADSPVIISEMLQDIGVLFEETGNYTEAKNYYHEAVSLIDEQGRAVPYLNLGWAYFRTNQLDSAGIYAGQSHRLLRDERDVFSLVSVYELLYCVEKTKENSREALAWHEQYADSLFVAQRKKNDLAIMELKKQYETESMKDKIRRKNITIAFVVVAALLVVAVVYIIMYRKNIRKNKKIEELNRLAATLEVMAASVDEVKKGEKNYRSIALKHFDAIKKMALVEAGLNDKEKKTNSALKKFNQAVYKDDEFDWEKMFRAFNLLEDGFLNKALKFFKKYPQLDETDFRVWCLSYAKLSQDEITLFLKLKVRNIQTRLTRIREVFGIEKRGSIDRFLKDKILQKIGI